MATKCLADRPWLLLPGTLCTGAVFDGLLDALGVPHAHRQHVPLDHPSVEDYRTTFAAVTKDTIVCGFSLGAIVAAHAADFMTVRTLVLFGINPHADDPAKAQSRRDLAADVMELGGAAALHSRALDLYGPSPDTTRAKIYAMADASTDQIDAQTRLALTRPGALTALEKAQMPVLSLTGSRDTSATPAEGWAAAQAAPQGQFRNLDGLGHFAVLEDPRACAAALLHFMETQHDPV